MAQDTVYPLQEDISSLDGIMKAYYEVVSGPQGQPREVERDVSLHHPSANVMVTGKDAEGVPFIRHLTLQEFHEQTARNGNPAFFEWEIHREVQTFGNITHVWSTYAWTSKKDGPIQGRGINSIQLYHDGERYWITSWFYDSERADNPIPANFLPDDQ